MMPVSSLIALLQKAGLSGNAFTKILKLITRYQKGSISQRELTKEVSLALRRKTALYRGIEKPYDPKKGMYTGNFRPWEYVKNKPTGWADIGLAKASPWPPRHPDRLYLSNQKKLAAKFPRKTRELEDTQKGFIQKFEVPNKYIKKHGKTRNLELREIPSYNQGLFDRFFGEGLVNKVYTKGETLFNLGLPKEFSKGVVKKQSRRFKDDRF